MNQYLLYRFTTRLAAPFLRLYLKLRVRWGKEDPNRLSERFGIAGAARPQGRLLWFHAASVGESQSVLPLIDRILYFYPEVSVLMTTGTLTSAELLKPKLSNRFVHQFIPLDHPDWVDSFLRHWQPNLAFWVESELWPNLIAATKRTGIELVLLNARMSADSFQNWQKMPAFIENVIKPFSLVLAQNSEYAGYFQKLGANAVEVSGNLKYAAPQLSCDQAEFEQMTRELSSRRKWCAASTHAGEESIAGRVHLQLKKHFPDMLTTIVPRHPQRGDNVRRELEHLGLKVAQRSKKERIGGDTDVYLADTLGELGLFFRLNQIVFVGNSIGTAKGGHNLLEPARFACAILHGPNMQNFLEMEQHMRHYAGCVTVRDGHELGAVIDRLIGDAAYRESLGSRAIEVAQSEDRVLDNVCARLLPFLGNPTLQQVANVARA